MKACGAALALTGALCGGATTAFAQELRFSTTQPGNVIAAGNTLGLAKQLGLNGPGTEDSIGTFSTLVPGSVDDFPLNPGNPWFEGTTNDWHDNGSTAILEIPNEAQILYAEVVWGGSFQYGDENVLADLNSSITLSAGGDSITVDPDPTTAVTVNVAGTFPIRYYMRSADVSAFVANHPGGEFAVEGVPATQSAISNTTNAAGWTLVLAYRYDGEPIRNMSVFVGGLFVDEDTTVDYAVDGFCAPPSEPIEGTIAIATLEGDSDRTGDQLAIGETIADPTFVTLDGPNNPENNFFCSQINGPDGLLDTTGTFGDRNHTPGSNTSGGRQGWDVTHLELTSDAGHLVPDQTSAVLRTQTNDDSYMPVLAGIAIDVNAPKFLYDNSTTSVDKDSVGIGDTFTLDVRLLNEGSAPANDLVFTLDLPAGIALNAFETNGAPGDINGAMVTLPMLGTGVPMGDLSSNEDVTVSATFEVTAAQADDIDLRPVWGYEYRICVNDQPTNEVFNASVVSVEYDDTTNEGGGGQGGSGTGGSMGDGGAGNQGNQGGAGGGSDDSGFVAIPEGGGFFRCTANGAGESSGTGAWLVFASALALGVSRRRRNH
ncbi:MAG: hypothetical protein HOW73_04030 [Polyangiaceae bacterium]|nr:hypothetical protein [Polyangiaceae bacterium]